MAQRSVGRMTPKVLTPSRLAVHHEVTLAARMARFAERGEWDSAEAMRLALAPIAAYRAKLAHTEQNASWLN